MIINDYPTYVLKLPSNNKEVTVRPFRVKEEKLLLMALESNEQEDIINTTKQVISNCIISGNVDVDKLPFFDVDYLFIALRAKSVGESIDVKYQCHNTTENRKCNANFDAKIDITNVDIHKKPDVTLDIKLSGTLSVKMRYPSYRTMKLLYEEDVHELDRKIDLISSCIEMIVEGDNVRTDKDITKEEKIAFVENLTRQQYVKLEYFIDNLPSFVVKSEAKCNKCGFVHKLEYNDFTSFFV